MADPNLERGKNELDDSRERLTIQIHFNIIQASAVIVVLIPTITALNQQLPETTRFALLASMYPFIGAAMISTFRLFRISRGRSVSTDSNYSPIAFTFGWLSLAVTLGIFTAGGGLLASIYLYIESIGVLVSMILFILDAGDVPLTFWRGKDKRISTEKSQPKN